MTNDKKARLACFTLPQAILDIIEEVGDRLDMDSTSTAKFLIYHGYRAFDECALGHPATLYKMKERGINTD